MGTIECPLASFPQGILGPTNGVRPRTKPLMDRPPDPSHSWHLVDAPSGTSDDDALDAALESEHATLAYGEHCFEFTSKVGSDGDCLLRLHELGRLTATASGRSILVFAREGHEAEERIVPCGDALDRIAGPRQNPACSSPPAGRCSPTRRASSMTWSRLHEPPLAVRRPAAARRWRPLLLQPTR